MSLLTETDSVPSRVRGLFSYLLTCTSAVNQSDLEKTLSPQVLGDGLERSKKTIKEASDLELIKIQGNQTIVLHTGLTKDECDPKNPDLTNQLLPSIITRLAFTNQDNNSNDDLGQAIAWVLTQSPIDKPIDWNKANKELLALDTDCQGHALGLNDVRFGNLIHWITYLGFARKEHVGRDAIAIVPDPTIAVRAALKTMLPDKSIKNLSAVMNGLAKILPVIDGGKSYLALLKTYPNLAPMPGHVSKALSMAFLRLNAEGVIKLSNLADGHEPKTLCVAGDGKIYNSIQRTI